MIVKEIFVWKFDFRCTGRNNLVKIQEGEINYMGRQISPHHIQQLEWENKKPE